MARKLDFYWFLMILEPFWVAKTEPRWANIDVERASKFDQFWKASWNATFSAQEAPRRASAADRRRRLDSWRIIEAPLGGSTAAQSFWSKEVCDKERSLGEQSFEILVLL